MTIGFMNYSYIGTDGEVRKIENVNVAEARSIQKQMGLSQKASMIEWGYRNGQISQEEYETFDIQTNQEATKAKTKKSTRSRKVDVDKKEIVSSLFEFLNGEVFAESVAGNVSAVVLENDQRLIRFQIGEDTYDLTLSRKRKAK